jgi:hypothetical protein
LTGRISAFLPFLPFEEGEQAVGAHKYILEYAKEVRKPVNPSAFPKREDEDDEEQLLGGVRLCVPEDVTLCTHLAKEYYDKDLGIRSLKNSVTLVKKELTNVYLKVEEDIVATDQLEDYVVGVNNGEITVHRRRKDA